MGHLLVIESWVGAMSTLLPRAIRESGHRFSFLTRDLGHYLRKPPPGHAVHPLLAAENLLTAETNDGAALPARVAALHGVLGFDGVVSACDYYLPAVAAVAEHLGLPGAGAEATARACRKDHARIALAAAGVPGPRFAVATGWPETAAAAAELGYPLVVKPVDLCAGMFVRRVETEAELRAAHGAVTASATNARQQPRVPAVLLEELLTGPEVSVETVTTGAGTVVAGVTDKSLTGAPFFVESGHMFPAALPEPERAAAAELAVAAVTALGLRLGVAHTEVRLTPAGPRLVEVNPRPAGNRITELVRRVTGIDLPMAHARLALGEQPELEPVRTGAASAAIGLVVPPRAGRLAAVGLRGGGAAAELAALPDVVEAVLPEPGTVAAEPTSNNTYLGHLMVVDRAGAGARRRAEELLDRLELRYAELAGAVAP
ncbi:ATP-grasp domain-containing protein [Nocardia sp. NPDC050697]|uniref:ATP-grasp domain-containing protein n=1 Tax=Nocardia sp. NPDC050697 TaxID=3155158 RepID=UPI0033CE3442